MNAPIIYIYICTIPFSTLDHVEPDSSGSRLPGSGRYHPLVSLQAAGRPTFCFGVRDCEVRFNLRWRAGSGTGLLKRYIWPSGNMAFCTSNKGTSPFTRQCSGVKCKDPLESTRGLGTFGNEPILLEGNKVGNRQGILGMNPEVFRVIPNSFLGKPWEKAHQAWE